MKIFFLTISFILGLYFLRNNIALSIIISLIYVIFLFLRFSKKTALIFLLVFIGGALIGNIRLEYNASNDTYQGMVIESKANYFIYQSHYEKFYVYNENNDKEVGDILTIYSKPTEYKATTYESQFNFVEYLKNKGVTRSLSLNKYETNFSNPIRIHNGKQAFLSQFDEDAKVLINAILFNEKDYKSTSLDPFVDLNLIYLISLSGIYLHLLFKGTRYVFHLFTSDKVADIVPIILFSPLIVLSFPRISILRIFLISVLSYINNHFLGKRFSYLTLLSSLALFFVITNYHLVYQESFYVGFSLSLLGLFFRKSIQTISSRKRKYLLAIYAYIFMLPLMSMNKCELHLFSFPFQVILIPFLLLLLIGAYINLLNIPLNTILNSYSNFLVGISKSLSKLDITLPFMVNEVFIFVYYAFLIVIIYLLESKRMRHLRNVSIALASFVVVSLVPYRIVLNSIHFINVGQGDSILIQNRDKNVLIDTGGNTSFDMAEETLIPYFNKIGVRHINLLITTHDDYDHAGAAPSLIENFKVYNYYTTRDKFPCRLGDIYLENINFYDGDENDSSLVIKLDFMGKKWLFTGDASIESEKSILKSGIDVDCDILKVGHHGSSTSSCDAFIRATSPEEAIISCGAKNRYGHPNEEVIERLQKYNVKIRRTDLEGTITYTSLF